MAAKARVVITAENQMSKGLLESKKALLEWQNSVKKISSVLSTAFNVTAITVAVKGISNISHTATASLNKLSASTVKLTKDTLKLTSAWVTGYEDMRLKYERLKLSLNSSREYEYVVNSIDTLAKSTTIAKDEIEAMASELALLGKSAKEIDKISKASVYLSTVTGRDLNSSMATLLNTFNGVTGQLDKLGLNMKKYTKEQLAAGAAIDAVIDKYEELNDQIAKTSLSQSIANIKESVNAVRDGLGAVIADAVGPVVKQVAEAVTDITELFSGIDGRMDFKGLLGLAKAFSDELFSQIQAAIDNPSTFQKISNFVTKLVSAIVPILTSGLVMAFNSAKAVMNSAGLANAQNNLVEDRNKYSDYVAKLLDKYKVDSLSKAYLKDYEEKKLTQLQENINIGIEEVERKSKQVVDNLNSAIAPAIEYIGSALPTAFNECVDAAKDLKTIVPGMWDSAFDVAENYLTEYRRSLVKLAPENGRSATNETSYGPKYTVSSSDPAWYAKMLVNTNATQEGWDELAAKLNTAVIPRLTAPLMGFASSQQTISEAWNDFISEESSADKNLFKMTYQQWIAQIKQNELLGSVTEEIIATASIVEKGLMNSWYQELKNTLFGYTAKVTRTDASGNKVTTDEWQMGLFNGLGQDEADYLGGVLDDVVGSLGIFGDMILNINPLLAVLKPVIEGFVSVMGPMVEAVLLPLQSTLTHIGELIAGLFAPLLDKIAPVFQFIANILMMIIQPVLALIEVPLQIIATTLVILEPILNMVGKAFEYLQIPINAFAATMQWLGVWIRFIILGIYNAFSWIWGGTQDNPIPESWHSYYNAMAEKTQYTPVGDTGIASTIAEGMISGTSTSAGVTNASYTGGGSITMNIYVNAPVVGSAGMEEFAIMLRKEFEAIGYYNVA